MEVPALYVMAFWGDAPPPPTRASGVELMCLILKQKRLARHGALKVLDFATTRFQVGWAVK
jgi:hypothetical protein